VRYVLEGTVTKAGDEVEHDPERKQVCSWKATLQF